MHVNNMGSVLAEDVFNAAVFIKDSPYCNTLHIALSVAGK